MKPKLDSAGETIGTDLIQVYSMNPAGSLPSMVTDKLMQKQQEGLVLITDFVRKNKKWEISYYLTIRYERI